MRSAPVLLAIGILLIPSCASVQEDNAVSDNAIPEDPIALEDLLVQAGVNDVAELQELADQGDADAQYHLGVMYANGLGVLQDQAEAARWYRLAADQGHVIAQYALGGMYIYFDDGVPQDYAEAVRLIRLAANQGHRNSQLTLGSLYQRGAGVLQDYVRAHMWANLLETR